MEGRPRSFVRVALNPLPARARQASAGPRGKQDTANEIVGATLVVAQGRHKACPCHESC